MRIVWIDPNFFYLYPNSIQTGGVVQFCPFSYLGACAKSWCVCVCTRSCCARANCSKKEEKSNEICLSPSRWTRNTKKIPNCPELQRLCFQVHFQSHKKKNNSLMPSPLIKSSEGRGGNRPGGVLYFLERRAGKCRGEASLFSAPPLICLPTGNKTLLKCVFPKILATSIKYTERPSFFSC